MTALEKEILERVRLLDPTARQHLIDLIEQEAEMLVSISVSDSENSIDNWLEWAEGFGAYIRQKYGDSIPASADLLNEAREERLDDLMGGR